MNRRGNVRYGAQWRLVCGALAASLCAAMVTTAGHPAAATAATAQTPGFVPGEAKADTGFFEAKVQITGAVGSGRGLAIGFGSGRALAQYADDNAASEGRVLDYSLLQVLNSQPTPECPNIVPLFANSTLPPLTRAESSNPAHAKSRLTEVRYAGWPDYGPVFGTQDATATAGPPLSSAAVTTAPIVDAGLITMWNPRSEVSTSLRGKTREARAIMSATSLSILGGAMVLYEPRWVAIARSGDTTTADARFSYSSATIFGMQRGPGTNSADLNAFKGFVENFFGFLGLKLILPEARVTDGGDGGPPRVTITPLTVAIENIPLGQNLIGPLLRAISPQLDAALAEYLAQPCSNKSYELLADVLKEVLSGTGGAALTVGGASAMTDDTYFPPVDFDDPIGEGGGGGGAVAAAGESAPTGVGGFDDFGAGGVSGGGFSPAFDAPVTFDGADLGADLGVDLAEEVTEGAEIAAGAAPTAAAPEVRRAARAAATNPARTSRPTWLMAAALAGVLALAGADQLVMRRSRRRILP